MALMDFDELYRRADARRPAVPVAAAGAADVTVLQALAEATSRGWVRPILVGAADRISAASAEAGTDISRMQLVESDDPAGAAVREVREGRARFLMKGQIDTPALLRAMLHAETGVRTGRTICQIVLMEILDQRRQFLLADTGITIEPSLEQRADIVRSVIDAARALGSREPRIALLSASEKETPAMPDTLESGELQRRNAAGDFAGAIVQGPLSFDLAYAADAAAKKQVGGAVPGAAEALVFPNLLAANLTVKAIMYTASCRFGGVLAGAACPVAFMSRADTAATRLNSLAFCLQLADR